jgi:hypothetical protein
MVLLDFVCLKKCGELHFGQERDLAHSTCRVGGQDPRGSRISPDFVVPTSVGLHIDPLALATLPEGESPNLRGNSTEFKKAVRYDFESLAIFGIVNKERLFRCSRSQRFPFFVRSDGSRPSRCGDRP